MVTEINEGRPYQSLKFGPTNGVTEPATKNPASNPVKISPPVTYSPTDAAREAQLAHRSDALPQAETTVLPKVPPHVPPAYSPTAQVLQLPNFDKKV